MAKKQPIRKKPQAAPKSKVIAKAPKKRKSANLKLQKIIPSLILRIRAYVRWFLIMPFTQLWNRKKIVAGHGNNYIYRAAFVVIFFVALIGMPLLSFDYGVSWDEKIQRDYGREIIKYYESGGRDTTLFDQTKHLYNTMLYYGCSFDVAASVIHDKVLHTKNEFDVRHFLNALFGIFAMLYTALIARYLGSWRTAVIAFAFCLLSPSLFGHSMNNPKDVPFAASYIFAIYHMIRFLNRLPRPRLHNVLGIITGIGWTISTRAGGLILIPFLGLFMAVMWLSLIKKSGIVAAFRQIKAYVFYMLIIGILGYLLGLIIWPYGQRDILHNTWDALQKLSKVNYLHTYENYDGQRIYMNNVPWHYTLKLIALGSPLFILIGCVLTAILAKWVSRKYNYNYIILLAFIFAFPIFYIVYKKSMVYNGWRHFLFVYLSLVVIASIGWEHLMVQINKKWVNITALAFLLFLCGKVGAWMVTNHPNEYIYFNELAGGTKGAYGNYETDYYSNTVKQAVEWLVNNEPVKHKKVNLVSNNELLTVSYYSDKLADSIKVLWTRDYERQKQDWDYAIFTSRTYSPFQIKHGYFPPKGTIHTIDVDGVPVCAIVKRQDKSMYEGYALSTKQKFAEALPYFAKAITFDSQDEEAYRMMALCLLNLRRSDEALVFIDKAIELFPESFMAYYLKGFYYISKQDVDNAEKMFNESIVRRINNGDAYAELGNIYIDKMNYLGALEYYNAALGYSHNQPATYTNMGIAYMNLNNYEYAITYLNMAVERNPRYVQAYEKMAICFEKLGDPETANQIRAEIVGLK